MIGLQFQTLQILVQLKCQSRWVRTPQVCTSETRLRPLGHSTSCMISEKSIVLFCRRYYPRSFLSKKAKRRGDNALIESQKHLVITQKDCHDLKRYFDSDTLETEWYYGSY